MIVMLDVIMFVFCLINVVVFGNYGVIFIGFLVKGKDIDLVIKIF